MCGRYSYWDTKNITEWYHCESTFSVPSHFNVTPSTYVPVIVAQIIASETERPRHITRVIQAMRWGLIPEWANSDTHSGFINARAETVNIKKSFKTSFISRRCIVPARGFYEWNQQNKQPYFFSNKSQHLAFAGIWDGGSSNMLPSVAIITTSSHASSHIHDRIPVILHSQEAITTWLHPTTPTTVLLDILNNANDSDLEYYKVNKQVNNPRTNDETLLEKIE